MPSGRLPKAYDPALVERVCSLYCEGQTQAEVAATLGLTQKVVWNLMRRHSLAARPATPRDQWADNNPGWKGDDAGKAAFHRRLYARFGKPNCCSQCGSVDASHYDYANLTGRYEDMADYAPMCRSCHATYDNKIVNIGGSHHA